MEKRGNGASPERYGLMKLLQESEKKENENRRSRGVTELELHIDGWAQEPQYDRANHRLIWALNLHTADDPQTIINYSIIALGREGIISITPLPIPNNNLEKTKQSANQLLNTISFNQGNRSALCG